MDDAAASVALVELIDGAVTAERFEGFTITVPAASWIAALIAVRDQLGVTFFDFLTAIDEGEDVFSVVAHLYAPPSGPHVHLRTIVPAAGSLASATSVFAGASWHERETFEMFGIGFDGHPALLPLLLPDGFEGHPLRKSFILAARATKSWPGAKEPGEGPELQAEGKPRRVNLPMGVPADPDSWPPTVAVETKDPHG